MPPDSTIETTVRRNAVQFLVQREIFCPTTGRVLDMDTCAVLIKIEDGNPAAVFAPEVADAFDAHPGAVAKLAAKGYRLVRGGRSAVG